MESGAAACDVEIPWRAAPRPATWRFRGERRRGLRRGSSAATDERLRYEIVEYPTVILIHDIYSEPFKYEGGAWKSAPDVVSYIEAFADLHDCDGWDDDVFEGARVTLGGGLDANQRALAFTEANRAARAYASERSIEVACADDSSQNVTIVRNDMPKEDTTKVLEVPSGHDEESGLSALEAFRELLRRAVTPAVTELTHKSQYGGHLNNADALGLLTIRPNTTQKKLGETLKQARAIASDLPLNRSYRLAFCRLGHDHIEGLEGQAQTDAVEARFAGPRRRYAVPAAAPPRSTPSRRRRDRPRRGDRRDRPRRGAAAIVPLSTAIT